MSFRLLILIGLAACAPSPVVHTRAAEELRRGYAYLDAADPERAAVAFEHALEFAPDLAEGWNGLGVVARSRGDLGSARRYLTRAVRLSPEFAEGLANLGEVLLASERTGEALETLRAALRLDPDLAGARLNLARALLQAGLLEPELRAVRWSEARREYLHLLEASPGSGAAHHDLAFLDYLGDRPAAAEAGYRAATERSPTPQAYLGLCLSLIRLGRCAEARAACDQCLALDPSSDACRVTRRGADACAE